MTDAEIRVLIQACRRIAAADNVEIPDVSVDSSELAQTVSQKGIAILTNKASILAAKTFAIAKEIDPPAWDPGRVMCVSETIIRQEKNTMKAIGVIVHEMGHAYNLAEGRVNNEANAQVFEIETLLKLKANPLPGYEFNNEQLDDFFAERMKGAFLQNRPDQPGYALLHHTIRTLAPVFKKTHEVYEANLGQHTDSVKNRSGFEEATKELARLAQESSEAKLSKTGQTMYGTYGKSKENSPKSKDDSPEKGPDITLS